MARPRRALPWPLAFVLVAGLGASTPLNAALPTDAPLPDHQRFLEEVLKRLRSDGEILQRYVYRRHVEERDRDGEGRVTARRTRTYEVRPLPDDPEGFRWIVERDGRPTPPDEIARHEAEYEQRLAAAREPESDAERRRRLAREAERRREEAANVEEVKRIFDAELVGRDLVAGVPTVIVSFTPKPDVKPRTRAGRLLKAVVGRAWFTETDYELVRVESKMIETVRYGWGLVASIHEGATATIERRQLTDGTWVPSRYEFRGRGRVLLVRGVQRDVSVTISNLREAPRDTRARPPE